tara:strand:- start:15172 stop:16077 length:906 start_codon:yes stop_codon:yes gene_type:complete
MKTTVFVPDIECDSCVKILTKKFKTISAIKQFTIKEDQIIFEHDEKSLSPEDIVKTIKEADFRAATNPFERKSFKERMRDFKENPAKYALERRGIIYALTIFIILSVLGIFAYFTFLHTIPNFAKDYGWWLLYLILSTTFLGFALWHIQSYKGKVTCMVGMQSGMMLGAILGATNGFFIGAFVGMLIGVLVGAWTGTCCGIMGVMEGMMAGLMGGTMGPMISLMMFFDHLLWFMPLYMLINIIILLGLSYLLFEEVVEHKQGIQKKHIDFVTFAFITLIVTVALAALMIYGPKSSFIIGGI